jgi:hypothetical protein
VKKGLIVVTVLLGLIIVVLVVTNPDRKSFLESVSNDVISSSDGLMSRVANEISAAHVSSNFVYHNYVLFSVVEVKATGKQATYIGLLGNWF